MPPGAGRGGAPSGRRGNFFSKKNECSISSVNCYEVRVIHTTLGVGEAKIQYGKEVFPNLRTALQILLTISVSVASCERSFSKLKLIKTYLRSTMCQERLSNLAILSVEKDAFDSINFDTIIDQFAEKKARKVTV